MTVRQGSTHPLLHLLAVLLRQVFLNICESDIPGLNLHREVPCLRLFCLHRYAATFHIAP